MDFKKILFLGFVFLAIVILSKFINTSLPAIDEELLKYVKSSDLDHIKNIIESGNIINRKTYDNAIIIGANNGNLEIYKLLESKVSRKAHRQAYHILSEKYKINPNDDFDF